MEELKFLCPDCCKDIYLKNYVKKNLDSNEACFICLKKINTTINIENTDLRDFCRFLIRYNYAESEYNSHWGGEELPNLFLNENKILSHEFADKDSRDDEIYYFLEYLFDLHNYDSEIELYYGYDEHGRNLWAKSLKDEKSNSWEYYKNELKKQNYYQLETDAKVTFNKILSDLKYTLNKSSLFYRARIGYIEKPEEISIGFSTFYTKIPYIGKEISAPPVIKAQAGRANREGVSYLYLASDEDTALGEVRPHPGHYVSVGQFTNNQDRLELADLRFIDLINYFRDDKKRELFMLLRDLSEELSIPILPNEKENYLVTQFISDIIRQLGFDGILFKSSVSSGFNLVAFDPTKFKNVESASKLIKIQSVKFTHKEVEYERDGFLDILIEK